MLRVCLYIEVSVGFNWGGGKGRHRAEVLGSAVIPLTLQYVAIGDILERCGGEGG